MLSRNHPHAVEAVLECVKRNWARRRIAAEVGACGWRGNTRSRKSCEEETPDVSTGGLIGVYRRVGYWGLVGFGIDVS